MLFCTGVGPLQSVSVGVGICVCTARRASNPHADACHRAGWCLCRRATGSRAARLPPVLRPWYGALRATPHDAQAAAQVPGSAHRLPGPARAPCTTAAAAGAGQPALRRAAAASRALHPQHVRSQIQPAPPPPKPPASGRRPGAGASPARRFLTQPAAPVAVPQDWTVARRSM